MSSEPSSRYKLRKKLKVASGRPKNNIVNPSKETRSRSKGNTESLTRPDKVEKRKFNSSTNGKQNRMEVSVGGPNAKRRIQQMNSDWKKKQIFPDQGRGLSGVKLQQAEDEFVKEEQITKGKSRDIDQSKKKTSLVRGKKPHGGEVLEFRRSKKFLPSSRVDIVKQDNIIGGKCSSRRVKDIVGCAKSSDTKLIIEMKSTKKAIVRMGGNGTGLSKKHGKGKSEANHLNQRHKKAALVKSSKETVRDRKGLGGDDSTVMVIRPKKRKRVIRIDPHDISNKRLDDSIAVNGQYSSQSLFSDPFRSLIRLCSSGFEDKYFFFFLITQN